MNNVQYKRVPDEICNGAMELRHNAIKVKYLQNRVVSPWNGKFHSPEHLSLFVRIYCLYQTAMTFQWHFCARFERAFSDRISKWTKCNSVFSFCICSCAEPSRHTTLASLLGYVKPMLLTSDYLSFALTYSWRTSRNLGCTETSRLQNKMHSMVNFNHSTKSNPMLTWKIMLWKSSMSQSSGAATSDLAMIIKSILTTLLFLNFNLQKRSHHDFVMVAYTVTAKSNL